MPSTSAKQAKFMRAVANSPKFAKKVGVKQSVGKDFEMADKKMKKFNSGGSSYPVKIDLDKAKRDTAARDALRNRPAKPVTQQDLDRQARMQGEEAKESKLMKTKAKGGKCYAKGGLAAGHKGANGIAKKGLTKGMEAKMAGGGKCYAKGGSVSSRADGIAKKGHTRGRVL